MFGYFRRKREAEEAERKANREATQRMFELVSMMISKSFEAQTAQNEAFKSFLDGYKVTEAPVLREYDEEAELQRYMKRKQDQGMPAALANMTPFEASEALIKRLNAEI